MRARPSVVLAIVASLVVVLAVIAALASRGREHPELDVGTPEGVVQLYVSALFDDDLATAAQYLDPALGCSDPLPQPYLNDTARIAVVKTTTTGDTAKVDLRIEEGSGLNGSWTHDENFTLRRDGGTWLLTGEPWPVFGCT